SGSDQHSYTWSNGMVGRTIEVSEGGPYRVRVIADNGCVATHSVQVPKHNDTYMWVLPTGCIAHCVSKENPWFTILPPLPYFVEHGWTRNGEIIQGGNYGTVDPLGVREEGVYQLYLEQGYCQSSSRGLVVVKTSQDCGKCDIYVKSHENYKREKYPYTAIIF
ncbi:hypothetical protein, partial [Flavobacterium sp. NKUCC04_CG]|uniref:hypothetical protein n=1 Tax=Flavobacterium sp. NKUCC04_CG TaxID=2842121 RepID=UPI001C5B253C